jgi:hypothetical protein
MRSSHSDRDSRRGWNPDSAGRSDWRRTARSRRVRPAGTACWVSCPPTQSVSSVMMTRWPLRARARAAAQPPTPPPAMITSARSSSGGFARAAPRARATAVPKTCLRSMASSVYPGMEGMLIGGMRRIPLLAMWCSSGAWGAGTIRSGGLRWYGRRRGHRSGGGARKLKVVLVEPRDHLGGMVTGGLSWTDIGRRGDRRHRPRFAWRVGNTSTRASYPGGRLAGVGLRAESRRVGVARMLAEAGATVLYRHRSGRRMVFAGLAGASQPS